MTDITRLIAHLDDTLSSHVVTKLGATIRQLHDWTGEFPASTSDAPPDSSPASTEGPETRVKLTKVESDAANPDEARRALVRIYVIVDALVLDTERLARAAHVGAIPAPDDRLAARLAYIAWQVNQCVRVTPPKTETDRAQTAVAHANELAGICERYRPPKVPEKWEAQCVSHQRAGLHANIDSRYSKRQLCGPCGNWCRDTGQVAVPVEIVRMLDKGNFRDARMPTTLRRFGVRVDPKRRGRTA
jgi:hypothetical protein